MLSWAEIRQALSASLLLARSDPAGHAMLDTSMTGFWRSFLAILLVAPIYLVAIPIELDLAGAASGEMREADLGFYVARLLTLCIDWVAYPVAMVFLARLLGFERSYAPYIVAYNWTTVLMEAAFLVPALLFALGLVAAGLTMFLNILVTAWAAYFRYFVARTALGTPPGTSVGLVVFDFALTLLIVLGSEAVFG